MRKVETSCPLQRSVRIESWLRRLGGQLYAIVRVSIGTRTPS